MQGGRCAEKVATPHISRFTPITYTPSIAGRDALGARRRQAPILSLCADLARILDLDFDLFVGGDESQIINTGLTDRCYCRSVLDVDRV